jgi:hypothetical protein
VGLLTLAGVGACGGNDTPTSAGATVPKATSTTSAAPYAVPATIDAAYLNKVFAALEHVIGDAGRAIVAEKALVPDAAKRLRAVYGEEEFQAQVNLWLDLLSKGATGFKPVPGDRVTAVRSVLSARPDCVYLGVTRDYSQIVAVPGSPTNEYISLRPADHSRDQFELNPTPWMLTFEGENRDGSVPPNPCAS